MNYQQAQAIKESRNAAALQSAVTQTHQANPARHVDLIAGEASVPPLYAASLICEERQQQTAKQIAIRRELANHPAGKYASDRARAIAVAKASGCTDNYVAHIMREDRDTAIGQEKTAVEKSRHQPNPAIPPATAEPLPEAIKELEPGITMTIPGRWVLRKDATKEDLLRELNQIAQTLRTGVEAVSGLYMRLVDIVREGNLPREIVRRHLAKYFRPPQVSEIMRVAEAPDDVWLKYHTGFFGFKAALKQCRSYNVSPTNVLKQKQAYNAANRLVELLDRPCEFTLPGWKITLTRLDSDSVRIPLKLTNWLAAEGTADPEILTAKQSAEPPEDTRTGPGN